MCSIRNSMRLGDLASAKRRRVAQYPTPVPDDLYVEVGIKAVSPTSLPRNSCHVSEDLSASYAQTFHGGHAVIPNDVSFFNLGCAHPFSHHPLPSYPSPSMGSEAITDDSDTAFISPLMAARTYPPQCSFPSSLKSNGGLGSYVDPGTLAAKADACMMPTDSIPLYVDSGPCRFSQNLEAGAVPQQQTIMGYIGSVADACSCCPQPLDLGGDEARHVLAELGAGIAPPPAALDILPHVQVLSEAPQLPFNGFTKSDAGLAFSEKAQGNRDSGLFPCLFRAAGCFTTFDGKNEWKRHINTVHVGWDAWVCAEGDCAALVIGGRGDLISRKPSFPIKGNPFNRRDLYLMHIARRHSHLLPSPPKSDKRLDTAEQLAVAKLAHHCRIQLPEDMEMFCSFQGCNESYSGSSLWDSFLEHVAEHVKSAPECSRNALDDCLNASMIGFGVGAGFLCREGRGRWRLTDPMCRDESTRRKDPRKRSKRHWAASPESRRAGVGRAARQVRLAAAHRQGT